MDNNHICINKFILTMNPVDISMSSHQSDPSLEVDIYVLEKEHWLNHLTGQVVEVMNGEGLYQ